jgi:KaiC/GvpD/RAD55 family RecA-like ATPase
LALDIALGVGGYPRGRIVEIYGPESSGKTTLTYTQLRKLKKLAFLVPSLTQNTLLTQLTLKIWELI